MAFFDPQNAYLNPSDTVVAIHVALDVSVPNRGDQVRLVLAQLRQNNGILAARYSTRGSVGVHLTVTSKGRSTSSARAAIRNVEDLTHLARIGDGRLGVLEAVAFHEHAAAGGNVKVVAGVVVEVVVDGLHGLGALGGADLGGAAGEVVKVVLVERDLVALATDDDGPVMIVVARVGELGAAVEFGVGDGDAGSLVAGGVSGELTLRRGLPTEKQTSVDRCG